MSSYHFDIVSDGAATRDVIDAPDDAAANRQALLVISEIIRDAAFSDDGAIVVRLIVSDAAGRRVWSGSASGGPG